MGRLFAGTPFDRPPTCERCGQLESACSCPPVAAEPVRIPPEKQTARLRVERRPKGKVVTVTGRLKSVVYTPRETVPTLEAELFDGSGSVTLVWLGRRRIPGIEPGRTLSAHGRFASFDGRQVIYNPRYELSAG